MRESLVMDVVSVECRQEFTDSNNSNRFFISVAEGVLHSLQQLPGAGLAVPSPEEGDHGLGGGQGRGSCPW